MANPSLYDLLDVDQTASDAEIRVAWKSAIADLDPADRRFRAYNQAAEVLLDPQQRAAYDAELAASEPAPAVEDERGAEPIATAPAPLKEPAAPTSAITSVSAWRPSGPLLIVLGVVTLVVLAATIYFATQPSDTEIADSTREAQSAAEQAIVPILSYDYNDLEGDQAEAQSYMTSDYRKDYDKLFEVLKDNAPSTRTVVKAEVIASGIVRSASETERVEILLFVDRPTTNKQQKEPVVYRDQVTVTMEKVGEDWLVDSLETSPAAP